MTVVGTVGHVDHGKTVLLQALTGIDADRLPEERRRGITIDVGYAHMALDDGSSLDFVDLPGHQDLAGNLLVGIGEMDAALLVVAADSGSEAQTFEHLDVLSAFGLRHGIVAVTKADLVGAQRRAEIAGELRDLIAGTVLDDAPIVVASGRSGEGIPLLREALAELNRAVCEARPPAHLDGGARLAVDRAFGVRGHGRVVTGTLRGGALAVGAELRVVPGEAALRVRGLQVHGHGVDHVEPGGRVAVNVAGRESVGLRRGVVLTANPGVIASDRLLVAVSARPDAHGRVRQPVTLHVGTDHVSGSLRWADEPRGGATRIAVLALDRSIAAAVGDRVLVRSPSPPRVLGGGIITDPQPPALRTRALRDRLDTAPRNEPLAFLLHYRRAVAEAELARTARAIGLRGSLERALPPGADRAGPIVLAPGLRDRLAEEVVGDLAAASGFRPAAQVRGLIAARLRRVGGIGRRDAETAARNLLGSIVRAGAASLRGDVVLTTAASNESAMLDAAEARLLSALDSPRPPPLSEAARAAGYPREGLNGLVAGGRIIRVAPDVAYAATAYRHLAELALGMAGRGELSAAAFRDAAATSRRHAVAVLDHLTLTGQLRRETDRHVPGPAADKPLDIGRSPAQRGGS